jgi:AraC-like DNA-binding protein
MLLVNTHKRRVLVRWFNVGIPWARRRVGGCCTRVSLLPRYSPLADKEKQQTSNSRKSKRAGLGDSWLDRLMNGEPPPNCPAVVPIHGVTVRKSTNVLAFRNDRLAKAMHYIQEHFREPITAADVVKFSGVSRQVLQRLFRQDIGHSILNVIMRSRLEEAKRMLRNTSFKLDIIAEKCGFRNRLHFHRTFFRLAGSPPASWRHEHRDKPMPRT